MTLTDAKDILSPMPPLPSADAMQTWAERVALTAAFLDGMKVMQLAEHIRLWPEREETPRYRAEIERLKTLYLGPNTASRRAGE